MQEKNFTVEFMHLVTNNKINGRITTNPFDNSRETMSTEISFNDITVKDNIALFIDDANEDRAETLGVFKLNLNQIREIHLMEDPLNLDGLYGKYNALILLGEDYDEVLIIFNMNDKSESPFTIDNEDALAFAYANNRIKLPFDVVNKSVEINLSAPSYQSRYNVDSCNYANPVFASFNIESFNYETSTVDNIPCITVTDNNNENIKLTLNAVLGVVKCANEDKNIFNVYCEIGLVSIREKGYKVSSNKEVA